MIQRTLFFSPFGSNAAKWVLAAVVTLTLSQISQAARAQEILEEYALPTGLAEGAEVLYQVLAGQLGIVPAPGYRLEMVVEAVASAGFEVDTANDDRHVIIAKPRSQSKSYADLSAEPAVLLAKAGEAGKWAGPVVRPTPIIDAKRSAES